MWGSICAFAVGAASMVIVSLLEQPKTTEELHGLVYGLEIKDRSDVATYSWYRSPVVLGVGVLVLNAALYVAVYAI
jgi:SSS family solute:Na+ symporter